MEDLVNFCKESDFSPIKQVWIKIYLIHKKKQTTNQQEIKEIDEIIEKLNLFNANELRSRFPLDKTNKRLYEKIK